MKSLLKRYSGFIEKHPRLPLVLTGLLTIAAIAGLLRLQLNLTWVSLAPKGNESAMAYEEILEEYPSLNPIIAVVEAPDYITEEKILGAIDDFFSDNKYVSNVYASPDADFLLKEGLLLWPEEELSMLSFLGNDPSLATVLTMQKQAAAAYSDDMLTKYRIGQEKAVYHLTKDTPDSKKALSYFLYGDNLIRSKDKSKFLVSITPSFEIDNYQLLIPGINDIEQKLKSIEDKYPGTGINLTGLHIMGRDEMNSVENDSILSTIISFVLILALLIISFRMLTAPIIASIPLIFGVIWDLGIAGFLIGRLNLMTAFVAVMLIGLGIDFSIHFLSGVTEKINSGKTPAAAILNTIYEVGPSIAVGGITTSVAFLTLALSSLDLLRELGIIMGIGILTTLAALFLILPSLLMTMRLKPERIMKVNVNYRFIGSIAYNAKRYAALTVMVILIGTVITGYYAFQNTFDLNILIMEPKGLASVITLDEVIEDFGLSADVFQLKVDSLESVDSYVDSLKKIDGAGLVQSIRDVLPSSADQQKKLMIFSGLKYSDKGTILPTGLKDMLLSDKMSISEISEASQRLINDEIIAMLSNAGKLKTLTPQSLPDDIKSQFVGKNSYLISIFPDFNIWAEIGNEKGINFLKHLQQVSPKTTGVPFFMRALYDSAKSEVFLFAAIILITIFAIITLHFKSIKWSAIATIPLIVTIIWTMGIMTLAGLKWNVLNVLALPLIIGIGVDDAVHILNRYLETGDSIAVTFGTVGRAILGTSLTTMIGFGALSFSSYRGIAYFGIILFIGVGLAFVMTSLIIPLFMTNKTKAIEKINASE
ncbi:MAG: efflux RND transporter permease subunit [Bacillota bacterium]